MKLEEVLGILVITIWIKNGVCDEGLTNDENDTYPNEPEIGHRDQSPLEPNLEDVDVLCSTHSDNGEREWTWLDVGDIDVDGYWREYGACVDQRGISQFTFMAFQLHNASNYGILKERCTEEGFDYPQPSRLYPNRPVVLSGWPDRGFVGINGPPSYQLGSGRPDSTLQRREQLAIDGWFTFHLQNTNIFTAGFLTLKSCRNIEFMKQDFQLNQINCKKYSHCL